MGCIQSQIVIEVASLRVSLSLNRPKTTVAGHGTALDMNGRLLQLAVLRAKNLPTLRALLSLIVPRVLFDGLAEFALSFRTVNQVSCVKTMPTPTAETIAGSSRASARALSEGSVLPCWLARSAAEICAGSASSCADIRSSNSISVVTTNTGVSEPPRGDRPNAPWYIASFQDPDKLHRRQAS